jgi:phage protein D
MTIRCMNKMHRLLRIRKSRTWTDKTDQQVIEAVLKDANLKLNWKGPSIQYKHVYQHNQPDLEFIRVRAARIGCFVWCVGDEVFVQEPDFGATTGITLEVAKSSKDAQLMTFTPRMNSASVVKKVTVRGWNPEKKELIEGSKEAGASQLGKTHASEASHDHGKEETFVADHPMTSKQEADALANSRLVDMNLTFIQGEAQVKGTEPKLELAKTVTIKANAEKEDDPFNGPYFIMGITHRQKSKGEGAPGKPAHAVLKLARDAMGPK